MTYSLEEVAEILLEVFGDPCACNYCGIDEWLPEKCKYGQDACPDPPDKLDCWKEYLLHRKEREQNGM